MADFHRPRRHDVPANASELRTPAEIDLEHLRERLRFAQEERKSLGRLWKGFVAVLAFLAVVETVAAATVVVGLLNGPVSLVVPSLWVLGGSGGLSVFIWRVYAAQIPARA
jgi:hypothetical protein